MKAVMLALIFAVATPAVAKTSKKLPKAAATAPADSAGGCESSDELLKRINSAGDCGTQFTSAQIDVSKVKATSWEPGNCAAIGSVLHTACENTPGFKAAIQNVTSVCCQYVPGKQQVELTLKGNHLNVAYNVDEMVDQESQIFCKLHQALNVRPRKASFNTDNCQAYGLAASFYLPE